MPDTNPCSTCGATEHASLVHRMAAALEWEQQAEELLHQRSMLVSKAMDEKVGELLRAAISPAAGSVTGQVKFTANDLKFAMKQFGIKEPQPPLPAARSGVTLVPDEIHTDTDQLELDL